MADSIVIDPRFCGPPGSGNGGYVCGMLAAHVEGDALVRLRVPPPLSTPLEVRGAEEGNGVVELCDGDTVVAVARPADIELGALPKAPDEAAARAAAERFRGNDDHPFPTCFVCGPDRAPGDGLCIFPGVVEGESIAASPWVPDASLVDPGRGDDRIAPEFLWAALDCPGAFSFPQRENAACVLGEFGTRIHRELRAGEPCIVVGWAIEHDGRKHRTGTALFDSAGDCIADALGTWIEIPRR